MFRSLAKQMLRAGFAERFELPKARAELLAAPDLTPEERALIERISLRLHSREEMYEPTKGGAAHYLSNGLSALRCIDGALKVAPLRDGVRSIADFPCGHGRVMRYLRARFPNATLYAAELDRSGLEFCRDTFAAVPLDTAAEFDALNLPHRFDLIWCGSLLTHLDEAHARALLRFFLRHLNPGGLSLFSMQGQYAADNLANGLAMYGLTDAAGKAVVAGYREKGFGFADYAGQTRYGIAVATRKFMGEMVSSVGAWKEVYFAERGWDNHHDVYGYQRLA